MDVKYMLEVQNVTIFQTTHVILLKKADYGFFQAAIQWWKMFKELMATCGYYPSRADQCLFIKKTADGEPSSFVLRYVDDGGIIRTPESRK
jgi:hypothetical protein